MTQKIRVSGKVLDVIYSYTDGWTKIKWLLTTKDGLNPREMISKYNPDLTDDLCFSLGIDVDDIESMLDKTYSVLLCKKDNGQIYVDPEGITNPDETGVETLMKSSPVQPVIPAVSKQEEIRFEASPTANSRASEGRKKGAITTFLKNLQSQIKNSGVYKSDYIGAFRPKLAEALETIMSERT